MKTTFKNDRLIMTPIEISSFKNYLKISLDYAKILYSNLNKKMF